MADNPFSFLLDKKTALIAVFHSSTASKSVPQQSGWPHFKSRLGLPQTCAEQHGQRYLMRLDLLTGSVGGKTIKSSCGTEKSGMCLRAVMVLKIRVKI